MDVKRGPFYEYSVVYTDRVFNLMSPTFQESMRDVSRLLQETYSASATVFIPGSGTYGMEAVARQFGLGKKCMVIRNGYFSYRWSDIFSVCGIPSEEIVLKAGPAPGQEGETLPQFEPMNIDKVVARIKEEKPDVVFAPHVETSVGILISDEYIKALSAAIHEVGGLLVIDDVAGGNVWLNMKELGIDALITAPQKGWTAPACIGIVMLSEAGVKVTKNTKSNSFCCNLAQWLDVMENYENKDGTTPGFRYYTTLPTDAIMQFHAAVKEAHSIGLPLLQDRMFELGNKVRQELKKRGFKSTAADSCASPGVVVVYSPISGMVPKFKAHHLQTAGGVPWKLDEEQFGVNSAAQTFRIGLFGFDKLLHVDDVVRRFTESLDKIMSENIETKL